MNYPQYDGEFDERLYKQDPREGFPEELPLDEVDADPKEE